MVKVNNKNECELMKIPNGNTNLALLGNIFLTEGKQDKVLCFYLINKLNKYKWILLGVKSAL